jgi:hypothetical protein
MNLNPIKANMTELETGNHRILFSYKTPVAVLHADGMTYRTEKRWSNTTSRHINQWLKSYGIMGAIEKPQEFFDGLVK